VIGVIEPGASAAVAATKSGHVGVIGTRATVQSKAYEKAIHAIDSAIKVRVQACPLLVPLIEEGWLEDPVTDQIIQRYLNPMVRSGIDTLVLGCTHYPLLSKALSRYVGSGITLVDSARNCAANVKAVLQKLSLSAPKTRPGGLKVALTDPSGSFLRVAEQALGLNVGDVELRSVQRAGV
jgi:glutamate racemase